MYIRDIGSLHGTFIDDGPDAIPKNDLVKIRNGSKVTFGIPIWRNQESFNPATVKVDISHPTVTTPGRGPAAGSTFALPEFVDDESSSSSDDDLEEVEEKTFVSNIQGPTKSTLVALSEGVAQREIDLIDLTDSESNDMDRTAGRLIDLTSPPRAASPVQSEQPDKDAGAMHSHIMNPNPSRLGDHGPDGADSDILSIVSEGSYPDRESLRLSDDEDTDSVDSGLSEDSMSIDSGFSDDDMVDDHSDDDEGMSIREGSSISSDRGDWDAEYSSGDDVLDHGKCCPPGGDNHFRRLTRKDDPDTATWAPAQESILPTPNPCVVPDNVDHDMNDAVFNTAPDTMRRYSPAVDSEHDPEAIRNSFYPVPRRTCGTLIDCDDPDPPHTDRALYWMDESRQAPLTTVYAPGRGPLGMSNLLNDPQAHYRYATYSDSHLESRSAHFPSALPVCGTSTAEVLGHKTGKQDFFEARGENRLKAFAPSHQSTSMLGNGESSSDWKADWSWDSDRYNMSAMYDAEPVTTQQAGSAVPSRIREIVREKSTSAVEEPLPVERTLPVVKAVVVEQFRIAENPAVKVKEAQPLANASPTEVHQSFAVGRTVVVTPLLRTGDDFLNHAQSPSVDLQQPTPPGDDNDEPSSAWDLKKRKEAANEVVEKMPKELTVDEVHRRTHVGISDIVNVKPTSALQPGKQALVAGKGKRKADDMVELTQPERRWESSESRFMGPLQAENEALEHNPLYANMDALIDEGLASLRATAAPEHEMRAVTRLNSMGDGRAPKRLRLRKIAERLGYAALGGATVGAALVSTLIYTAPTFT